MENPVHKIDWWHCRWSPITLKGQSEPNRKWFTWFDLSRSPEVNKFDIVWKGVYNFLLANNSNFVAVSHHLEAIGDQSTEISSPLRLTGGSEHFEKVDTVVDDGGIWPPMSQKNWLKRKSYVVKWILGLSRFFRQNAVVFKEASLSASITTRT